MDRKKLDAELAKLTYGVAVIAVHILNKPTPPSLRNNPTSWESVTSITGWTPCRT